MAEPTGSPSSSSSPLSERLSEEHFLELPQSLEDQGVELGIVLSIQPLSSRPPPSDTGSLSNIGPESPNNPIQTPESPPTSEGQLRLVVYPLNPLFDPVVISPQRPYNSYNQMGIPSELSPRTSSIVRRCLFSPMESEGEIPVSSLGHSNVSATHTPHVNDEQEYEFPPEAFPNMGRVSSLSYPETNGPMLPHGYTTLA